MHVALTHTMITLARLSMMLHVSAFALGISLCPWYFGHSREEMRNINIGATTTHSILCGSNAYVFL